MRLRFPGAETPLLEVRLSAAGNLAKARDVLSCVGVEKRGLYRPWGENVDEVVDVAIGG